ncbi:MAG: BTAD domain-containing putative transcriptional regulator [Gemmatimonadota bacterium]
MAYRLNILGTLELRDAAGAHINSVLQQPRRLALLVYLGLADREAMVKRDTLLGVFWPDMSQENGRRALSQAIHFLRRSLGRDAILARGNEDLALNTDLVQCDAAQFLAAAKAGDLQAAAAAYGGELLPGFFVSGAQEFDQWLESSRQGLRRTAADVFWSAAEHARQNGQPVSAAALARRAVELAADSESATRRLMEFLESIHDRAGALDAYDGLARKLQSEFETSPSQKTRELAERIRRSGQVEAPAQIEPAVPVPAAARLRTLPWQEIRKRSRTLTGATILMVAFLSLWGVGTRTGRTTAPRNDASVMIDAPEGFDVALRDAVSTIMSGASAALVAVPRLTVFADATAPGANAANAHYVLRPEVANLNGELRVSASLVEIPTGTIVRSASFRAEADDAASLHALGLDMAEFARKAMGRHLRMSQIAALRGENAHVLSEAILARIRADSLRDNGQSEYALVTLDRVDATLKDALARERRADLYIERAEIARKKAWIHLLPPHQDRGLSASVSTGGVELADAAIEIDPRNAAALEIRGLLEYDLWFRNAHPHETASHRSEAEEFLRATVRLNPRGGRAWSALASILIAKGEFNEAYWAAERAYAADTYLEVADAVTASLLTASLEIGDLNAAARWCADISRRSGDSWVGGYCALQLIARSDAPSQADVARANEIIARIDEIPVNAPFRPLLNSIFAVVHAKADNTAQSLALLGASETEAMAEVIQPYKAWALLEIGRSEEARAVITRYVEKNPSGRAGVLRSTVFSALQ